MHVLWGHVPDVLGEVPVVALGVLGGVDAVAVELVGGLPEDGGAGGPSGLEVAVQVVDIEVDELGGAAEMLRVAVLGAGEAHHDDTVAAPELGVDGRAVGS